MGKKYISQINMYLFFIKDDLKLAIQRAMNDEDMQKSIEKMHDLFTGKYFSYTVLIRLTAFSKA